MKRITLLVLFLASFVIVSGFVAACDNVVSGTVYMLRDSRPVADASVTVVCNNNVQKTTSGYDGSYSAFYSREDCPKDSKVKITAKKGRLQGHTVETMKDYGVTVDLGMGSEEVDLAIADVFLKRVGSTNPKLQLSGFVDDYTKDVFVRIANYGRNSDATLTATLLSTGETQREDLNLGMGNKKLRVFQFGTIDLVPGENVIELFAQAGNSRATKYISYYNK